MIMTFLALAAMSSMPTATPPEGYLRVYVGTYTRGESRGIYVLDLDLDTGELRPRGLVAETTNPSFLAIHPNGDLLFAVNEVMEWEGQESGGVSAFRIDPASGGLTLLNQQPSGGGAPCYLIVDKSGKYVLVANYAGGSVASFPIRPDSTLGPAASFIQHEGSSVNPDRQEGPHAHSINVDPANRFALAADLGLDEVLVYRFDSETGVLTPNDPPSASVTPGAGPRHGSFHPSGRFFYVVDELDMTVTAFAYDSTAGALDVIQTVPTLPEAESGAGSDSTGIPEGYSTAEIQVHPSGRFLYASNRGANTIAVFAINQETGLLTPVEYEPTLGRTPRNFGIDPSGRYLLAANQNSGTVVAFWIDQETGALTPTGSVAKVPTPVCLKFATTVIIP